MQLDKKAFFFAEEKIEENKEDALSVLLLYTLIASVFTEFLLN